jgi:hypothetical protein
MDTGDAVSSLWILRLVGGLLIAVALFWWFMRKRSNRHPMEHTRERNWDEIRRGDPPEPK